MSEKTIAQLTPADNPFVSREAQPALSSADCVTGAFTTESGTQAKVGPESFPVAQPLDPYLNARRPTVLGWPHAS